MELRLFNTCGPSRVRLYFFRAGRPCPPPAETEVALTVVRPDGVCETLAFTREAGCLGSTAEISAPHEFEAVLDWGGEVLRTTLTEDRSRHGQPHLVTGQADVSAETDRLGIRTLKISLIVMLATAIPQAAIAYWTGSVALLADTIHNFSDATTSIPLWIAFALTLRRPSRRYTYGFGRTEDWAGLVILVVIFFSACVAGYVSVLKLLEPRPMANLWAVATAAVVGFLGNEAVALLRLRAGRKIHSAALIADGYHARADGFTSLAVLGGVAGTWLGFPILDPLIGLGITAAILYIVKDSAQSIFLHILDGIEPSLLNTIETVPLHVRGVSSVSSAKARWMGHRVLAELHLVIETMPVGQLGALNREVEAVLKDHLPAFGGVTIQTEPEG